MTEARRSFPKTFFDCQKADSGRKGGESDEHGHEYQRGYDHGVHGFGHVQLQQRHRHGGRAALRFRLRRCGGHAGVHRRGGGNGRTRADHAHHGQTARRGAGGFTGRHGLRREHVERLRLDVVAESVAGTDGRAARYGARDGCDDQIQRQRSCRRDGLYGAGRLGRCAGHCRYSGRIESGGCRQHGSGESLGYRDRYDDSVRHGGGACGRGCRCFCLCAGEQQHDRRGAGRGDEVRRADCGRFRHDLAGYRSGDGRAGERGHQGQSGWYDAERDAARHEEQRQERRNRYRQNQSRADQRRRKLSLVCRYHPRYRQGDQQHDRQPARRGTGRNLRRRVTQGYSGDAQAGTRRAGRDD